MRLSRWTPVVLLFPGRYLPTGGKVSELNLKEWSENEYEWSQDAWKGLRDSAKPVEETIKEGKGDCEDYALVALSWLKANGHTDIGLCVMYDVGLKVRGHVVAYHGDRTFSSGSIEDISPSEYAEREGYNVTVRRRAS